MIKRIVLFLILTLSLFSPILAAESDSGVIEGQVVNSSINSGSVADQVITLKIYLNEAEVSSTETTTDAEGKFTFNGLATGPEYGYGIMIVYQQAEYYSEWLSFGEGETTVPVEVTVYNSTTSVDSIQVTTAHTFIYIEEGSLWVREVFVFSNDSDLTYIGSKEINQGEDRETLLFPVPGKATDLEAEYGLMDCCIYPSEGGFVDTMPVFPGTKQVLYSYRVDYSSGDYAFSQKVNYPTAIYNLLVQGESTGVTSRQLTAGGQIEIEGTTFNLLSGGNFAPGDTLVAQLSGLPKTINQGVILWTSAALVLLLGGVVSGYIFKRRKALPVSSKITPTQRKQGLLTELARLDNDFESGKVRKEAYHKLRAEKKAQLVELMQRAEEESGNR